MASEIVAPPPTDTSASPPPVSTLSPPPPTPTAPPPSESSPPPLLSPPPTSSSSSPPPPVEQDTLLATADATSTTVPNFSATPPLGHGRSPSKQLPPPMQLFNIDDDFAFGNGDGGDNGNMVVMGAGLGVGLFLVLMLVGLLICCRKKKSSYDASGYKGGYYANVTLPRWQNGGNKMEQNGRPPPCPFVYQGGGWNGQVAVAPPPLPTYNGDLSSDHSSYSLPSYSQASLGFNQSTFSVEDLSIATSGFSENNLLGQGGFGYVFKGVLLNGKEIAVKQLKAGSGDREFHAEVEIISRVHHRHLVSLVGYCIAGTQRMFVYEFVPNRTLDHHLHGNNQLAMDWASRLKIAIGSAKGLAYLHEDCYPRIIHRDIKTANILLDYKFEAKVADFGLAKLSEDTNTHVSTRVMGTFGYLAPEYASTGKLTEKSDVFSFGVVLLELITGRPPVDRTHKFMEDSLVDWAEPLISKALAENNFDELVDPRLKNVYDKSEMARMAACAAACIRHSSRRRPKMSKIVRALEGDLSLEDLNEGTKPGHGNLMSPGSDIDSNSSSPNFGQFKKVSLGPDNNEDQSSGATTNSSNSADMSDFGARRSRNIQLIGL